MIEKVTLKDIAEDSGLSVSTVSRALTRSGKISKENEKKVFQSAQRLNYPLTVLHTPIELKENINIALVTRHYTGEFFASLFEGFDQCTKNTKARINLISVSHTTNNPEYIAAEIRKSHFDAAVIFLPDYKASDYSDLLKHIPNEFPVVSIAPIANPVIETVTFDNYRGGYLVASHFEEQGYKSVGIIEGPLNKSEAMLRKNGFLDYVRASQTMNLVWDYNGDYSLEKGKSAYNNYKLSTYKPEAIFCCNDGMTFGFIHEALRDGVNIPEDVAIVGFDDLPTCEFYTPTISSVHTPYELLGKKTIELIFDKLFNNALHGHTGYTSLVPVTLSIRESSTQLNHAALNLYKDLT